MNFMDGVSRYYYTHKTSINKIAGILAMVLGIFLFVKWLFYYIAPFVFAFLLSLLLEYPVGYFNRRFKIPRTVGTLFFMVLILTLIIILSTNIVLRVQTELLNLSQNFPNLIDEAGVVIGRFTSGYESFLGMIPEEVSEYADSLIKQMTSSITSFLGSSVKTGSVNFVTMLPNALLNTILFVLSTFFLTKDKPLIKKTILALAPPRLTEWFVKMRSGLYTALKGYVKAQLILMSVTASIGILGLTIMGNQYSLVIGLVVAFIDALPIFGSGFVFWPWIAFCLINGNYRYALGLSVIYGTVFLTRQLLEPKVLGQQIGVHPLLTLLSIYIGLKVFGFLGFFIGPLIMVITKTLFADAPQKPAEEITASGGA